MGPRIALFSFLLVLPLFPAPSHAADRKLTRDQLPAPVRKAADAQSPGAVVRGYSSETENHQLIYEVELTIGSHSKDVSIAPDGRILEVEEQVDFAHLPSAVQAGLSSKTPRSNIQKIESLTKGGKLVAYEAEVRRNGKQFEIQVGPSGEPLAHPE